MSNRNFCLFVLLYVALAANSAFAVSGGNFLVVPGAEVLPHANYQVKGSLGVRDSTYPLVTALRFGLFNVVDIGVQYGRKVSFDVRTQIRDTDGFMPAIALGARAFVENPEAHFYSVEKSERSVQTGEFYLVGSFGGDWWTALAGVSAFTAMDSNDVAPFWGFEQSLFTKKLAAVYEGFFRYGNSKHAIGLSLRPMKGLNITAGATEFQRHFVKRWNKGTDGYDTPGFYFTIAITGSVANDKLPNTRRELDSLKMQVYKQEQLITDMNTRLDDIEMLYYNGGSSDSLRAYMNNLDLEFDNIMKLYASDDWNMDSLRLKEEIFIEKGMPAKRYLLRTIKNTYSTQEARVTAIRIMSHFPDALYLMPLGSVMVNESNDIIAREAALALGTINTIEARRILFENANLTHGVVRETVIQILGAL